MDKFIKSQFHFQESTETQAMLDILGVTFSNRQFTSSPELLLQKSSMNQETILSGGNECLFLV